MRTRLTPALVRWALAGADIDVDVEDFTAWLIERQERNGAPVLDQEAVRKAAIDFQAA